MERKAAIRYSDAFNPVSLMSISPFKFREIVFQLMYGADFGSADDAIVPLIMGQLAVTKRVVREAQELKGRIDAKCAEIDQKIREESVAYDFERIPRVERNILRLSVYELLFSEEVPPKVSIAEAIRLTRKFATPEAASFINAILDSIYQKSVKHVCAAAD